jgi:ankyrin repeat protein
MTLHEAVREGHLQAVECLLTENDVDLPDSHMNTPLIIASGQGHIDIVQLLLSRNANSSAQNNHFKTALHKAAKYGKKDVVSLLVSQMSDQSLCIQDYKRRTALSIAAKYGFQEIVEILLDKGCDKDTEDASNFTAIQLAVQNGHTQVVKLLISRGATLNSASTSTLILAAKTGNLEIFKLLLENGCKYKFPQSNELRAIHIAAQYGHVSIIEYLLDSGVESVSPREYDCRSVLHIAAAYRQLDVMKFLLDRGADINIKTTQLLNSDSIDIDDEKVIPNETTDDHKITPLHICAELGDVETVKFLLDSGANASENKYNQSALHYGVRSKNIELIELLVSRGFEVDLFGTDGLTPIHEAAKLGLFDVVKMLLNVLGKPLQTKRGRSLLHCAAYGGNVELIQYCLDAKYQLNNADVLGWTPLHYAAEGGNIEAVNLLLSLLQSNGDVPRVTFAGQTVFHCASLSGNVALLQLLVEKGFDPCEQSLKGYTPLCEAASNGHYEAVLFLANIMDSKGVSLQHSSDFEGLHPAMYHAVIGGHTAMVEFLLDRGFEVDALDENQKSLLHRAVEAGHKDIVELLLNRGADIHHRPKGLYGVAHRACKAGNFDILDLLIKRNADVNLETSQKKHTPLFLAACKGHFRVVKLLVENKANIHAQTALGSFASAGAAYNNHIEIVRYLFDKEFENRELNQPYIDMQLGNSKRTAPVNKPVTIILTSQGRLCADSRDLVEYLLDNNANPMARDKWDNTLIHVAAEQGNTKLIQRLLDSDVSPNVTNEKLSTPLWVAARDGKIEAAKLLLAAKANVNAAIKSCHTPLLTTTKRGFIEMAKLLLDHAADPNAVTDKSWTTIYMAANTGNFELVKLFLSVGVNPNAQVRDKNTALHSACMHGHYEIAKLLLDHGVDTILVNKLGNTPLLSAVNGGNARIVQMLIDHGLEVNFQNAKGWSPLHCAVDSKHLEILRLLLDNPKTDRHITTLQGWSALHMAADRGAIDHVKLLLEYGLDINARSQSGLTPLSRAVTKKFLETAEFLLANNADPNCEVVSKSPLVYAKENDMIELLLRNNASITSVCEYGGARAKIVSILKSFPDFKQRLYQTDQEIGSLRNTALKAAICSQNPEAVELILKCQVDPNSNRNPELNERFFTIPDPVLPVHVAAEMSRHTIDILQMLVKHNADINVQDHKLRTPLHIAISRHYWSTAGWLLDHGARTDLYSVLPEQNWVPNGCEAPVEHDTPLHTLARIVAAYKHTGFHQVTKKLISLSSPNQLDSFQQTPFHIVLSQLRSNQSSMCAVYLFQQLITMGHADLRSHIPFPLHYACNLNNVMLLDAILTIPETDWDITELNDKGQTALLIALERSSEPLVRALLQYCYTESTMPFPDFTSPTCSELVCDILENDKFFTLSIIDRESTFDIVIHSGQKGLPVRTVTLSVKK